MLSAALAAGAFIAAPALPDGTNLFTAPVVAAAAGTVYSGTTTQNTTEPLIYHDFGTVRLYFKKPVSGTQVQICGSRISGSNASLYLSAATFSDHGVTYTITGIAAGAFRNQTNLGSFYFSEHTLSYI